MESGKKVSLRRFWLTRRSWFRGEKKKEKRFGASYSKKKKKLLVSWQFSGTYGITKYGSGWRKDVVTQCLEFDSEHLFPAPSSKPCQIWLRHWRGTLYLRTAIHRRGQRPPKGLGANQTPSTGLRHPSFNYCRIYLRHRVQKTVS